MNKFIGQIRPKNTFFYLVIQFITISQLGERGFQPCLKVYSLYFCHLMKPKNITFDYHLTVGI